MYDVIHVLHHVLYSTVTAQDVSVESLTQQPTCPNDSLTFNCQLDFSSTFIQWKHTKLGSLVFIDNSKSVGDTVNTAGGRIVANLTRKDDGDTDSQSLFSSTLTIFPPLNNVNNTNLDNTSITCEGNGPSGFGIDVAPISLFGEQLRLCFIIYDYLTHCLCMYPLQVQVPLPLLMT